MTTLLETEQQPDTSTSTILDEDEGVRNEPLDPLYFDFSPYTRPNPFPLRRSDAQRLAVNEGLDGRRELYGLPEFSNPSNNFQNNINGFVRSPGDEIYAAGTFGYVLRGTYEGRDAVAKVMKADTQKAALEVLQENLIHAILLEAAQSLPERCAKIPHLYNVFRTTGFMHRRRTRADERIVLDTESGPKQVIVIVMEFIQTDLNHWMKQATTTAAERSKVCAGVLVHVLNSIEYFNSLRLNFMHADLKTNNIVINLRDGTDGFDSYFIDFGMASLNYNGVRIGAGQIFNTIRFKIPGYKNYCTDIVYLVWSMWKFSRCDMTLQTPCPQFTSSFDKILRYILYKSGIPFDTKSTFHSINHRTFRAMLTAGREIVQADRNAEGAHFIPYRDHLLRQELHRMGAVDADPKSEVFIAALETANKLISEQMMAQYLSTPYLDVHFMTVDNIRALLHLYIISKFSPSEPKKIRAVLKLAEIRIPPP